MPALMRRLTVNSKVTTLLRYPVGGHIAHKEIENALNSIKQRRIPARDQILIDLITTGGIRQ